MSLKAIWMGLPRPARIYLTAVGGATIAGFAVVATVAATGTQLAASPSPSPSPSSKSSSTQAYCDRFVGHLASDLGKSQDQVNKAISDALNQTLSDAVKNGDLTQKQADAIKSRLGNGKVCAAGLEKGIAGIGRPYRPLTVPATTASTTSTWRALRKWSRVTHSLRTGRPRCAREARTTAWNDP